MTRWFPHATVATIVAHDNRYLLVEEHAEHGIAFNQPAGHLEEGETLIEAAIRETLEETGWQVEVTALLGISRYVATNAQTYLRFSFIAKPLSHDPTLPLDDGIIAAHWLSRQEIEAMAVASSPSAFKPGELARQALDDTQASKTPRQLRSPLVLNDILRYEQGERLPLSSVYEHPPL